jgi:protoporphyrinogen/coproporphyrinogen III oxidase
MKTEDELEYKLANQRVAIVGAGFSGLTLAWYLTKLGVQVEMFEQSSRCGGMIATRSGRILSESAANAILCSSAVEELFAELGIEIVGSGYRSKKRYISTDQMRTWPLGFLETASGILKFIGSVLTKKVKPFETETVRQWIDRVLSEPFAVKLVSPALQGIYGVGAERLSAVLIWQSMQHKIFKSSRGRWRGSVAPLNGMEEIIKKLRTRLEEKSVIFHLNSRPQLVELQSQFKQIVLAVPVGVAAELIQKAAPRLSELLAAVPTQPLSSVSMGFENKKKLQGFGVLFSNTYKKQKAQSLGVLFNTDIFPARGELESETWIMSHHHLTDEEKIQLALKDRKQILNLDEQPQCVSVASWPKALPLYGFELKKALSSEYFQLGDALPESVYPLFLTGNYLGGIGLGKILNYNRQLAESIRSRM